MGFALDLDWMMGFLSRITAGRGCCFFFFYSFLSFFPLQTFSGCNFG